MGLTDYAGTWEYKGTITPGLSIPPNRYDWKRFPYATTSASSNIRITYYCDESKLKTYGYIRQVYDMGDLVYGKWFRIHPKDEKEILDLQVPEEILINSAAIPRYFEITKVYRRYWRGYGNVQDTAWSVGLEVLEQAALPAEVLNILQNNPGKTLNVGNAGNIIVVLESQQENP